MSDIDEIIAEFLIESREGLDQLDRDLVALEETPEDREILARIFRCFHTVKGTSGFLGFGKLEQLTHAAESVLGEMRDGRLRAGGELTSTLLETVDAVRHMLGEVEAGGSDGDRNFDALSQALWALRNAAPAKPAPPPVAVAAQPNLPLPLPASAPQQQAAPTPAPAPPPQREPQEAAAQQPSSAKENGEARGGTPVGDNVRVDVELLDSLVDLAGELVLTRNHLMQLTKKREDAALVAVAQRLNLVTAQLQTGIMGMRMQPVSTLFTKFPRLVRDLARSCRKLVRLEIDGADTELDKSLLAAIKDPITHLLRNCLDHGAEPPDVRTARGKHPEARIMLRSYQKGGLVHIEVADDGNGIAFDKVRRKAVTNRLLSEERAAALSDSEVAGLIFLPGFSTAEEITNVSGRGVGMDVVKTNVEHLGGTVEVTSRAGQGTTFTLKIPLTLAIVPAFVIECSGQRYAIPQVNVLELVRLDGSRDRLSIEWIHGAPVYRLRDQLVPIVFLEEALGAGPVGEADMDRGEDAPTRHVVVMQSGGGQQFGLVVDSVTDHQEIVVKPLPRLLRGVAVFAGATLLGDGRIALILDVLAIAERARVFSAIREDAPVQRHEQELNAATDQLTLLLLRGTDDERMAVPLDSVARLETIELDLIESGGRHDVVQYRGSIMPLLHPEQWLPERRAQLRSASPAASPVRHRSLSVVVFGAGSRPIGLVVDDVIDVVDTRERPKRVGCRDGVKGTLVVQSRVTEVLDLSWIARAAGIDPNASLPPPAQPEAQPSQGAG